MSTPVAGAGSAAVAGRAGRGDAADVKSKFAHLVGGEEGGKPAALTGGFYLMTTGQIEGAEFPGESDLFCTYTFTHGPDWTIVHGVDTAVSQISQRSDAGDTASFVWNFPLDITYKTTNAFGWPRLVVTVVARDMFHRYVVKGYGAVALPTVPGRYVREVRTFAPAASSKIQEWAAWITGNYPQFYDPKFVGRGEGREVTRVRSTGVVRIAFNVMTRGMESHGYSSGGTKDAPAA